MSTTSSEEDEEDSKRIEECVKREVGTDIREDRVSEIIATIIGSVTGVLILGTLLYLAASFVVGSYIGESDMQRVSWGATYPQFNARMNEIIATKDTTQLLQVQRDMKWIQDTFNKPSNK